MGDFKIVIDELDDEDFRVGEIEKIVYSEQDVSFNSIFWFAHTELIMRFLECD